MFKLLTTDQNARRGRFTTAHGDIETPVFMNVGTQAAIKGGISTRDLEDIDCQVQLSNTYHLHVRPGEGIVRRLGGLHGFMSWSRPILTDSGGFQVFSLAALRKINEDGVEFASHVDGRRIYMSPENSIQIQSALGSDIAMAFDECVENPASYEYSKKSCDRTYRWLVRCRDELERQNSLPGVLNPSQVLFGINQGGTYDDLRIEHMKSIAELDLPGYAIGGLAVGEEASEMYRVIGVVEPHMPANRPRYLMGVGTPQNILTAVSLGIDFFDCVLPARNARHGKLYTRNGSINIKNLAYENDGAPIEEGCPCPACSRYSRAYIRHLFKCGEILALRLCVLHNLYFYNRLMSEIRRAIESRNYNNFKNEFLNKYHSGSLNTGIL